MSAQSRRFSTGLSFLDRRIGGGIPVGKLLALTAPASAQSELVLYHLASVQPIHYVSTTNPDEIELRGGIEESAIDAPVDLEYAYVPPQDLLDAPAQYLGELRPESYVIVDPIDMLEGLDRDRYLSFVNTLKRHLRKRDCIGVFHGLDTDPIPAGRRLTMKRADHVWQLEQLVLSRELKTRLLVTKARGGRPLSEPIPISIGDHIRVDTSRRIA